MRVVDTKAPFTGQGVMAAETMRMINAGVPKNELRTRVSALVPKIYGYAVIPDVYFLRERARRWGDRSVGLASALLGKALDIAPIICSNNGETYPAAHVRGFESSVRRLFDYATRRIRAGLVSPYVCISYAGPEETIAQMPGFDELAAVAQEHGVELLTSMTSINAAVNVGPGTLNLALAAEPHTFDAPEGA